MTSLGLCSISDVITLNQNLHYLYSLSEEGKHLSNDTQARMISSMESEICNKMLRNVSEILRANFPATRSGYFVVKIAHIDDAFFDGFQREENQVQI